MRFIVGLIFGAVASLLVAAFIEQPQPVNKAAPVATAAEPSQQANDAPIEAPVLNTSRPAAALVETAVTPPKPTPKPEYSKTDKPAPVPTAGPATPVEKHPITVTKHLPAASNELSLQQVAVWSPFHSEASAQGFASRLTQQVEHPFRVNKLGPARYAVVYEFANAEQQARLAEKIAIATGAPRP